MTSLDTPTATSEGAAPATGPDTAPGRHLEVPFRRQAERTPDAAAVVWLRAAKGRGGRGDAAGPWTYRRLDEAAGEVARRLAARGVSPGDRVALCLERSPWLVAAILGTLRAGATYVPLDPAYPRQRLAFMLRDSGASTLITQPSLLDVLPRDTAADLGDGLLTLDPESGFDGDAPAAEDPSFPAVDGDHLSHLIYTSGSTGTPKGVAVRHSSSAAMVAWARETFSAAERAGVLAATSVCFDLSVFELFLPLTTGGTVLLARDALELTELAPGDLEENPVTLINTVPTAITELLHADAVPATVTTVNLAGEALKRHLVERIYALGHVDKVYNLYGPSEDTTYSTWELVPRGEELPVTIGRALPGGRAAVLGRDLRPVPDGEVGELCLAGVGLARGYFDRPAKTAEVFVPDALSEEAHGSRLYRTGDLARRMEDGRLEFLGRIDHQVKLRGFRIELGEIEEALLTHPAVHAAVAHVFDGGAEGSDPTLVVYWSGADGYDTPTAELETHLAETLPEYMVPGRWVRFDELPQTPTGKIDRKALPAPSRERPDVGVDYRPPETPTEGFIADLWGELMSIDRVGADDDLFALGGHSLIATRASVRIQTELGVTLPPEAPFLFPTVAELAAEVDRRREAGPDPDDAVPEMPPARRYPRDGHIPLGFPQSQIWIINQLRPENLAYNFQFTVRLHGPLDHGALEATLSEVVRRHEALRTTFPAVDGEPTQVIHDPWPVTVPLADLSGLEESVKRREEARLIPKLCRRRFDVLELPLMVWPMLRLGDREHLYFQVEQHFVHDGWSIGRMMFELEAIYPAVVEGRPHPMPELPVQYADFAIWQREWMSGAALAHQLDYWREILADTPAPLEIPTDRPRTPSQRFAGRRLDVDVPPKLNRALREMGRRTGFTLFMLMTAAFEALMYRYSGRKDFVIGTALANRRQKEFEPIIGMIVNTLVLRADFSDSDAGTAPTFMEVLERVRTATLGLQAHQDIPFERLVADLQPERDLSRNPIYQHGFSFHDAAVPDLQFGGLRGELVERHNGSAKMDLNIVVKPRASQRAGSAPSAEDDLLRVLWEYSIDLFDDSTARRQWRHFLGLLAAVVEEPETPVDRLPLMAPEERRQVLVEWGRGREADAAGASAETPEAVLPRVLDAARAHPDAPAVLTADATLTYGELDRRSAALARRIAHHLGARTGADAGGTADAVVGVCLPPSPDLLVAVLAAQRAGAAYLPLDPGHPEDRLRYSLADSGAPLVLTHAELAAGALDGVEAETWAVDEMELDGAGGDGAAPAADAAIDRPPATPDQLAYVIYTSGTTGRPKGTGLTHRGLARLVDWHHQTYSLAAGDRGSLVASPAFDASVWEIWPYLAAGAALCVPPAELRLDPAALYGWLAERQVTVAFVPTPLAEAMLEGAPPAGLALRALLVGGDRLHTPPPRDLPFRLVNHYGPTEDTVVTTAGEVKPPPAERPAATTPAPSIGRPIAGHRVLVLDRALEPQPAGIEGELWIAGEGLARGYLGRPRLTADLFRPHPLAGEAVADGDPVIAAPGARAYRTGDLARWRADGRLDFLGRTDHQVQLRGFRIELGEIEEALLAHPGVGEAVVVVRGSGTDAELVGYWTATGAEEADGEAVPESADLEAHLGRRLPGYMVPKRWVLLDELPLTPTDKVDRDALPDPGPKERAAAGELVAPRNATEATLAEIWGTVLGVDELGVHDGFFALGGHSLAAAKVVARANTAFGLELTLPDLFDHPTVAAFARLVDSHGGGAAETGGRPIPRAEGDRHAGLPASFDQQRLWLIDRLIPRPSTYHIGRAHRFRGDLDPAALAAAVDALGRRHEVLRTTFAGGGGGDGAGGTEVSVLQKVTPLDGDGPVLRLATLDLSALPDGGGDPGGGGEADRVLRRAVEAPFDLTSDHPVRAVLLTHSGNGTGGDHTLLLTLHHIAADGWSLPLVYRDLAELYRAATAGDAPELPVLTTQYADFAAWQRSRLSGEREEELGRFWQERMAGAPEVLELPTDRPRPALRSMRGGRVEGRLPAETTERLREVARERGTTLFTALLAGWAALLGRLSGQDDVVLGSPVAARDHSDLEPLVGFFVNTLPLRLDLARDVAAEAPGDTAHATARTAGFGELVERAREAVLSAVAHRELPFERLVEAVAPERNLAHSPLYQVTLAYQEGEEPRLELAGADGEIDSRSVPVERRDAHFEMTLFASAADDGGLELTLSYERDLFDQATVLRWADHLERLLSAAVADPRAPVSTLPWMSPEERRQVTAWSRGDAPPSGEPQVPTFHAVLEAAAARPDAPAVVAADVTLTYGDLERRSASLARRIRTAAAGDEMLVAVCLPPSPEMVVAVLASQRAGAAYLPLDPDHPAERLRYTLDDSGAAVVVTSGDLADGALGEILRRTSATVLRLDGDVDGREVGEVGEGHLDRPPATPDQLAYVIYTSGTTGRPKGTGLTHRGLARLVAWHRATYGVTAEDRGALVASPAFDASVWELWPCLAAGAALVVPPKELRLDPSGLYRWLAGRGVGITFLPTPVFEALPLEELAATSNGGAPRVILVGGDRLHRPPPPGLAFRLVNHYGPTEDTVVTTAGEVAPAEPGGTAPPPTIGRPIPGHRVHLLDEELAAVPPGVSGELWVTGDGLARGYLGRPGLTADRFRPHPEPASPGERLYRTGDLARWRKGGELAFLGRRDRQVQLRGLRIEPAEIEAVLADHPEVRGAAVAVDGDGGAQRLVAFISPPPRDGDEAARSAELVAALGERLPAYMVPSAFAFLTELPLSPTGKVDRRELARRAAEAATDGGDEARPLQGETEEAVAAVWADVLGLPSGTVGAGGDFFVLGGHSLLATEALSELERRFGVDLPLRTIFQSPTVTEMARHLEQALRSAEQGPPEDGGGPGPIRRLDRTTDRGPAHPTPEPLSSEDDDAR